MSNITISVYDNGTQIQVVENNLKVSVSLFQVSIAVSYHQANISVLMNQINIRLSTCLPPTPAQIQSALSALPEYTDNESAAADLPTGGMYWAQQGTDSLIAGGLYRVI